MVGGGYLRYRRVDGMTRVKNQIDSSMSGGESLKYRLVVRCGSIIQIENRTQGSTIQKILRERGEVNQNIEYFMYQYVCK